MIPTREEIEEHEKLTGTLSYGWLCAMRDEIDRLQFHQRDAAMAKLRAELDAAHTEAALARDALDKANGELAERTDDIAWCKDEFEFIKRQLSSIGRTFDIDGPREGIAVLAADFNSMRNDNISLKADAVRLQSELDMTNAQIAKARDALAKAKTAPSEDGKALLRELRAKLVGHGYLDLDLPMRTIDEMLARPAPVEQPAPTPYISTSVIPPQYRALQPLRLLRALNAAEAECDKLRAEVDAVLGELKLMEMKVVTCGVAATHPDPLLTSTKECYSKTWNSPQAEEVRALRAERDAAESLAWDALGRPDGTHDTTNVQRLCDGYMRLAESERAWSCLAVDRGAKLAALVEASDPVADALRDTAGDAHSAYLDSYESARADAKEQPPDLDHLTR